MSKKILILASDFPYPPYHGGRVDMLERIKILKNLGHEVYLISTVKDYPSKDEILYMDNLVKKNILIKRKQSIFGLFSLYPYQVTSRNNTEAMKKTIQFINEIEFDFCIIEGHYLLNIFCNIRDQIKIKKVYLRVHNDEKKYFSELAKSTNNIFKKIFYYSESIKFSFLEKHFFNKNILDGCLHISIDEFSKYSKKYAFMKNVFLPASVDLSEFREYQCKDNKTVLFIGSLFMPNNIEGLYWYLKNIHIHISKKFDDYKLIIAGNTKGINIKALIKYLSKYQKIEFIDSPKNLDDLYQRSSVFINPMLSGAGVKLKTINAVKFGLPIVSTKVGNEGTGLKDKEDILIAENAKTFLDSLIYLLNNEKEREKLVTNSQKYIQNNYNQEKNLSKILESK